MNARTNAASRPPSNTAPPLVAIILLAGRGTRLAPLSDTMHKTLIEISGEAILTRQLRQLGACGVTRFILVTGYRANEVREFATQHAPKNVMLDFVTNAAFAETNTAYSLALALDHLAATNGSAGTFLLLDGDVMVDDTLPASLLARARENVVLCETARERLNNEAVKVRLDANGLIERIGKAIPLSQAAGESIGVGLYQADWAEALRQRLALVRKHRHEWNWYYEDAMDTLLVTGQAPSALRIEPTGGASWIEVDDHEDLARARHLYSSSSSSSE